MLRRKCVFGFDGIQTRDIVLAVTLTITLHVHL